MDQRISELESELDSDAKLDRLDGVARRVSHIATALMRDLPFAPAYADFPVSLNMRSLRASVEAPERTISMRDIGSDENALTLHVVFALAIQQVLGERGRPVPGVLVFDQLSRPYFPRDKHRTQVPLHDETAPADERGKLKRYFNKIFEFVETERVQVIILEHAYFPDDKRFMAAVREQWFGEVKLIPIDWPSA